MIISKEMYVLKRKDTDEYMRNNGYFRDLNDTGKSAIKLYESERLCRSAVKFEENYDFVPVKVTIERMEK